MMDSSPSVEVPETIHDDLTSLFADTRWADGRLFGGLGVGPTYTDFALWTTEQIDQPTTDRPWNPR